MKVYRVKFKNGFGQVAFFNNYHKRLFKDACAIARSRDEQLKENFVEWICMAIAMSSPFSLYDKKEIRLQNVYTRCYRAYLRILGGLKNDR